MAVVVPTYTSQREMPLGPNQLPSVRMTAAPTADQLGANQRAPTDYIGAGLREVSTVAVQIQQERQAREDADMVFRAETMARDRIRKQTAEWAQRRGIQSWGVTDEAAGWYENNLGDIREGLNERQRRAFDQTVSNMRQTTLDRLSVHEATERRVSLDESASAAAASAIGFGLDNLDRVDEKGGRIAIDEARAEIRRTVDVRAGLQGWTGVQKDLHAEKLLTTLHTQAIERLSDQSPDAAEAYYQKYQHEIDPSGKAKLEKGIQSASRLVKAQEIADDIEARGLSEKEALAEVRKRLSGEDEKVAIAEVQSRFVDARRARAEAEREAMDAAMRALGPGGTSIARIPPSTWNRLSAEQQAQLETRTYYARQRQVADSNRVDAAEARAQRNRDAALKEQSAGRYWDISNQIDDMRPGEGAEGMREYIREQVDSQQITRDDGLKLLKRLSDHHKPPGAGSDPENIKGAVTQIGRRAAATSSLSKPNKAAFEQAFQARVFEEQSVKGRQITQSEAQAIVNEMLAKGTTDLDFWFIDASETRFEAEQRNRLDRWTPADAPTLESDEGAPKPSATPRSALEAIQMGYPVEEQPEGAFYFKDGNWYPL